MTSPAERRAAPMCVSPWVRWPGTLRTAVLAVATVVATSAIGCGGEVIEPQVDRNYPDASTVDGDSDRVVLAGSCVPCEGQIECGYCLIQAYDTTWVCPPLHGAPQSGCMNLRESHNTLGGEPFTCHYCD